jgi:hypothetical protein
LFFCNLVDTGREEEPDMDDLLLLSKAQMPQIRCNWLGNLLMNAARILTVLFTSHISIFPAEASFSDCANLYVSDVYFSMSDPRPVAKLSESLGGASSITIYPNVGHTDRAYEQLYAALLAASISKVRVTVTTTAPNGCSLQTSPYLSGLSVAG